MSAVASALRCLVDATLILYSTSIVAFIWRARRTDKYLASSFFTLYTIVCIAQCILMIVSSVEDYTDM